MARAMEVLRATYPEFSQRSLDSFLGWAYSVLLPQMDFYVDVITPNALQLGKRALYGNWCARVCLPQRGARERP